MKKQLLLLLTLPLILSGCGGNKNNNNDNTPSGGGDETPTDQGTIDDSTNYNGDRDGGMETNGTPGLVYAYTEYKRGETTTNGYMVSGYVGSNANVVIPESFNGQNVIGIDEFAFRDNLVIESLEIGKNVIFIQHYAFQHNFNMKKLSIAKGNPYFTLEDGVIYHVEENVKDMYIGEAGRYFSFDAVDKGVTAFMGGCMSSFENLIHLRFHMKQFNKLPRPALSFLFNPTYGRNGYEYARYYLDRMRNDYVPHLSSIEIEGDLNNADYNYISTYFATKCYSLTSVVINDGIKHLSGAAFKDCVLLRNVKLPTNTLESLGANCFQGCSSFYKIWIPLNADYTIKIYDYFLRDVSSGMSGGIFLAGAGNRYSPSTGAWDSSSSTSTKYGSMKYSASYEEYSAYTPNVAAVSIPADPA